METKLHTGWSMIDSSDTTEPPNECKGNVGTHGSCVRIDPCAPFDSSMCPSSDNPLYKKRKNIRAEFHDYSGGVYFITICTREKCHYFGRIANGEMLFTSIGEYCQLQLEQAKMHYPYVEIPLFVVMPNHLHAIISIKSTAKTQQAHEPCGPTVRTALSVIVGGLKRSVTMFARRHNMEFGWQSRYHDHIIRGIADGNKIADYIENNVARWDTDCFNK